MHFGPDGWVYVEVGGLTGLSENSARMRVSRALEKLRRVLQRQGINVPAATLSSKNVAAVMVTADIPAFKKPGSRIDITVSSLGDAKTLQGGVLLQTPLIGVDGEIYAVAQGPLSIGGFAAGEHD